MNISRNQKRRRNDEERMTRLNLREHPTKGMKRGRHVLLALLFIVAILVCVISYFSTLLAEMTSDHFATRRRDASLSVQEMDKGLHIVVSHCSHPLDWIFDKYLAGVSFKSVTIITKCGQPPFANVAIELPAHAMIRIQTVPNVGRCDHSYALWIEQMLESRQLALAGLYHPNDQVLFMKDNPNTHRTASWERQRSLDMMRNRTERRGFACGARVVIQTPSGVGTNYADKQTLGAFSLNGYPSPTQTNTSAPFQATFSPMSLWIENLPVNLSYSTEGIVEVCYAGVFMSSIQHILNAPVGNWSAIVTALSRGDNIEEGHFMERLWAGLLAPVPQEKQKALLEAKQQINGMLGVLILRNDSKILMEEE